MFSSDGEFVEFNHSVLLDGPVEVSIAEIFSFHFQAQRTVGYPTIHTFVHFLIKFLQLMQENSFDELF